jgi:hypothetical protein
MLACYLSLLIVEVLFCHMVNSDHRIRLEVSFSLSFAQIDWELGVFNVLQFVRDWQSNCIRQHVRHHFCVLSEANRRHWRLVAECIQPLLPA